MAFLIRIIQYILVCLYLMAPNKKMLGSTIIQSRTLVYMAWCRADIRISKVEISNDTEDNGIEMGT